MPDLIAIANQLKMLPDQALASELQNPSGFAPAYLVLGELQRRQLLRAGGGTQQKAGTSVLQDTMRQLEPPRPVGPPPPPGMTPPTMAQPRTGIAAAMPGTVPPENMGMPMRMPPRPMQEGGLLTDSSSDYLQQTMLRQQYGMGDLLPGMYARGGTVERFQEGGEEDDEESDQPYRLASGPVYDPTPAEQAQLDEIARRESGGNPKARNPHSTASGLYQFINSTWKDTAAKTGVGKEYASAAAAPTRDQQINALHLLREYGPNASQSWAASGPYTPPFLPAGSVTAPGSPVAADTTAPTLLADASLSPIPPGPTTTGPAARPDLVSQLAGPLTIPSPYTTMIPSGVPGVPDIPAGATPELQAQQELIRAKQAGGQSFSDLLQQNTQAVDNLYSTTTAACRGPWAS
jgi:hypothetical protein